MKDIIDSIGRFVSRTARAVGMYSKAIAAALTPFLVDAVAQALPELQGSDDKLVATIATVIAVFLIPNAKRPNTAVAVEVHQRP